MPHVNRTVIDPAQLCPTCSKPLRVHEWRTVFGNGGHTDWTRSRISCDGGCGMAAVLTGR